MSSPSVKNNLNNGNRPRIFITYGLSRNKGVHNFIIERYFFFFILFFGFFFYFFLFF